MDLNENEFDAKQQTNSFLRTPVQAAAEQGDIALLERLGRLGADINAPPRSSNGGVTALQAASIKGYFGLVSRLLALHADPNAPGAEINGRTAVEGAAERGRLDVVQLLLNPGVETYGSGRRQYIRAIEMAREEGHHAVIALLKAHRPWTEADQEILDEGIAVLLHYDQSPAGIAELRRNLDNILAQAADETSREDEHSLTTSTVASGHQLKIESSESLDDDPEEAYINPLPSSTLEEIREALRDNNEAPGLPGDSIWAEAYENMSSEFSWLIE
ncbi:ankyrin repeat protein [Colletotrichum tofieldiae]|uniref:Ankyrin repeat protein n=1 Tax=Colletotrichum tofieldiae TaxID=708197 RepID=A0A166Z5K2_9PEZI|nr:ankyrin repeat protein [Colletotrichum tofieldiae]GKT80328.1 ankyrin repeat protein [Colletotrichum tofieldiae]